MPARLINITHPAAAGGSVFFFQPGTLIQVNVFTNDAATIVATQPIALDQYGKTAFAVYSTVPVRAVFFNSNGAQITDDEREVGERAEITSLVNSRWPNESTVDAALTALALSLGDLDGKSKASFQGAVSRTVQDRLQDVINVKDFGAKGDDVTNNDQFFINAINFASSVGKTAVIRIPAGTYRFLNPINCMPVGATNRVIFQGDGIGATILKAVAFSSGVFLFNSAGTFPYDLKDLTITNTSTSTAAAVISQGSLQPFYSNVDVSGFRTGFSLFNGTAILCKVVTDGNAAASAFEVVSFPACYILFCTTGNQTGPGGAGIRIKSGAGAGGINIIGCTIPQNSSQGVLLESGHNFNVGGGVIAFNNFTTGVASAGGITCSADTTGLQNGQVFGNYGAYSIVENAVSLDVIQNPVAGVLTLPLAKSRYFKATLAAATAITFSSPAAGAQGTAFPHHDDIYTVNLQNSTGGGFAITAGANTVLQTGGFTVAATSQSIILMKYDSNAAKLIQITAPVAMAVT